MTAKVNRLSAIGGEAPTNGAMPTLEISQPYIANVRIKGVADILFHRWNCEAVAEKSAAAKGSKAKKTDNVESFVYRNDDGELCCPGEYLRQSIIHAAKFRQDPRSPRKSAFDLFKAGLLSLTTLASFGKADWDYLHMCRVQVQRNAVTRSRPAIKAGWELDFQIMSNLPEYIPSDTLYETMANAGRLIGLADFRPTYGRFQIVKFEIQE